jgi:hypothetical protein
VGESCDLHLVAEGLPAWRELSGTWHGVPAALEIEAFALSEELRRQGARLEIAANPDGSLHWSIHLAQPLRPDPFSRLATLRVRALKAGSGRMELHDLTLIDAQGQPRQATFQGAQLEIQSLQR